MTPEREAEIREWTAQKQHCEFYGSHWLMASDLLAEIDRLQAENDSLRKGYTSVQEKYLTTFDYDAIKAHLEGK